MNYMQAKAEAAALLKENAALKDKLAAAHGAAHAAISRALDEAGIRESVLRGMCVVVGLEVFDDALAAAAKGVKS